MKIGLLEVKTIFEIELEVFKVGALEDGPLEVGDLQDITANCSSSCLGAFFLSFFFFSFIQQQDRKVLNILEYGLLYRLHIIIN